MVNRKYATWHEVPKTKENMYAVLFGYLYVEYYGHLYEFIGYEEVPRTNKGNIILSDINNGDPLFSSWYEILYSPAFTIVRKE